MPLSQLEICNAALGECPSARIASLAEKSQQADECNRAYGQVLGEFVEEFGYDFAKVRGSMAALVNDRPAEWGYAYALPANCATPLRVIPDLSSPAAGYTLLVGQTVAPVRDLSGPDPFRISYEIAGATLYTNEPNATLEYVRSDVNASMFPRIFVRAMELELASRIVMPLLKSRARQGELAKAAEILKQRAMAVNLNRQPTSWNEPITEEERARDGWY